MKKFAYRTVLAFVLTLVALGVPCVAWYVVGCREAEREAIRVETEQWRLARKTTTQLAERILIRIQSLRDAEEKRPFYHYQNLYHDPKGAYEGASVVPSPLAQGPTDPLVRAYFQVDAAGQLTCPTLNTEVAEVGANVAEDLALPQAIQQELEISMRSSKCVAFPAPGAPALPVPSQVALTTAVVAPPPAATQQSQSQSTVSQRQKVELLDPAAWEQNLSANKLYADIRNEKTKGTVRFQTAVSAKGLVMIHVGAFQWCTTPINGQPALFALREVTTPQGVLTQGFLISSATVAESLKGAAFPAKFTPRGASKSSQIAASVGDTSWQVVVDTARAVGSTSARAKNVKTTFLRFFFAGVAAASVAGLCVVGLVWETERLAHERSQFAASAAHELRTPLAGLRMYSEMLAEGLGDPTRAKDYARRVADEAERLGRVVANVLGFTRLERGTMQVRPELGDLAAAVRECVTRQQPALEAAGARVEVSIAEDLSPVKFDRDALAEIVQNLLDNAEKHTRAATDRTIHVALASDTNGIALSVADRGPGISAAVRGRLFRPFARGENVDAPAGLGLGLVLVQALVRAHGGKIAYSDAPGGGAMFTVTFPL